MADKTEVRRIGGFGDEANQEVTLTYRQKADGTYVLVTDVSGASGVFLITPDNSNDLDQMTWGISFAAAGDLKIDDEEGNTVVIPSGALAAGIIHPIHATRVYATGTSATGIVGYY